MKDKNKTMSAGLAILVVLFAIIFLIFIISKPQPKFDLPVNTKEELSRLRAYDFGFPTYYGWYDYPYGGVPFRRSPYWGYWKLGWRRPGWRRRGWGWW